MSNRYDDPLPNALEEQAYTEARQHFASQLRQFPVSRETIERLERSLSVMALAANMAASGPVDLAIRTDDGVKWCKSVDLMDNLYLCHRPLPGGVEYALVEYFPARGTNEIWHRGWNAIDVLKVFVEEQRQALEIWTEDMKAQVKEFLMEKYPGHDMSRVADGFVHRFMHGLAQHGQSSKPNHNRGMRL